MDNMLRSTLTAVPPSVIGQMFTRFKIYFLASTKLRK